MNEIESVEDSSSDDTGKEKEERINELEREIQLQNMKLKDLRNKINDHYEQIQSLQNDLGELDRKAADKKYAQKTLENEQDPTIITLQEQIAYLFRKIQKQCNANLQEKYKAQSIEQLINQEVQLKISYLIIKKLEIDEEFYKKNNIKESQNPYENFKALNQKNLLNYKSLKYCGPNLVFRCTEYSKFSEIKEKCCSIWKLNQNSYSLYDDSFSSLECVHNSEIQKYFSIFQPTDSTLPSGHIVFYLIEKIKTQKGILSIQEKALSKENSDSQEQGNNYDGGQTDIIIDNLKEGNILKGLKRYHKKPYNSQKEFKNILSQVDNHCVIFFFAIFFVVLSVITISVRMGNIKRWSHTTKKNEIFLSQMDTGINNYDTTMEAIVDYFRNIATAHLPNNNKLDYNFLQPYGYSQFRFFSTETASCFLKHLDGKDLAKVYTDITHASCMEKGYSKKTQMDDHIKQLFGDMNVTLNTADKIKHKYSDAISDMSNGGMIYKYNPNKDATKLQGEMDQLFSAILDDKNLRAIQAIEFSFVFYDPSTNLFISNTFLAQKEMTKAFISHVYSIPFDTRVYEKRLWLMIIDLIRVLLAIAILITIPIQIVQKINKLDKRRKTTSEVIMVVFNNLLHVKSVAIIIANAFLIRAFVIFCFKKVKTQDHQDEVQAGTANYYDYYQFSLSQKQARYSDVIGFFLIFLFALKYFQLIEKVNVLIKSFKKCLFEYLLIGCVVTILLIAISLSTTYVYGPMIKEFSTFRESMIVNIQIVLFLEKTNILLRASEFHKPFMTALLLFIVLVIRLFFLNLFYPILVEYMRVQVERFERTKPGKLISASQKITTFFSCDRDEKNLKKALKKTGDPKADFNADELLGRE